MSKPKYDSTVARIAGNIASGLNHEAYTPEEMAVLCVQRARAIVAEVQRTEPTPEGQE